jgi:iron complex transport system substrate-binding protein
MRIVRLPASGPRPPATGEGRLAALATTVAAAHALLLGVALCASAVAPQALQAGPPRRIVSLVPAVTEMLFAMGAGDRVIGVSSFDRHPPEVARRTKVGGLIDPDLERILSLRPDLVVVYASQEELRQQMRRAAIPTFDYRHAGLADVTATIRVLGRRAGAAAADELATSIERRIAAVSKAVEGRPRPNTALVFGRQPLSLRNVYVSGGVGFLHDLLAAAGADNAFADVARESLQASTETLLARAPQLIVELHYARPTTADELARERRVWDALPGVPAVRSGRIIQLVGDEFVVPGPRVAEACERLARAIHPEAFGKF